MSRFDRRRFLQTSLGSASAACFGGSWLRAAAPDDAPRRKLPVAAVATIYNPNSHADVIVGKILEGFDQKGGSGPDLELAALYVDQFEGSDMSRGLAAKYRFPITKTIEEAITLGTGKVAVAGVLSIGEHGKYPETPDTHQYLYPRRRFFDEIVQTFEKCGQVVPVFNDKHLAAPWADAKHMYDTARRMKVPFLAGSSIPVAWRSPPLTLPRDCDLREALALGFGGLEAYGFHALEGLQCMVERRKGGETGVARVQAVQGDAIEQALAAGRWSEDLFAAAVATTPPPAGGHPKKMSDKTVFYLIEYRDGLKAAVAMETGMAPQFAFAGRLGGEPQPAATCFRLQDGKPYGHFAFLVQAIDQMIHTGKPSYPVERTLLTTGVLDALLHSHAAGGKPVETPELDIRYEPVDWPFAQGLPPS